MSNFHFDVITLFPKAFELIKNSGVITRALEKNLVENWRSSEGRRGRIRHNYW